MIDAQEEFFSPKIEPRHLRRWAVSRKPLRHTDERALPKGGNVVARHDDSVVIPRLDAVRRSSFYKASRLDGHIFLANIFEIDFRLLDLEFSCSTPFGAWCKDLLRTVFL